MKIGPAALAIAISVSSSALAQQAVQWRVEDGGNGHWYMVAQSFFTRWDQARDFAQSMGGHLLTVTSQAEQTFASEVAFATTPQSIDDCWIGGFQDPSAADYSEPSGGWRWVTGEPWGFTAWRWDGQPKDTNGSFNFIATTTVPADQLGWVDSSQSHSPGNCQAFIEWSADCNNDGIIDYGQCRNGSLDDVDDNNVPDCCEAGVPCEVGGEVVCWGLNNHGQATPPAGLGSVRRVDPGLYHTLVVKSDGTVAAWGWNSHGQSNVPVDLGPVLQIAGGYQHSAALTELGIVRCWGSNEYGQCVPPADIGVVSGIAVGDVHTIAVRTDGTVRCWGANHFGQCDVPAGLAGISHASGGAHFTLARRQDGSVVGWGRNDHGQIAIPPSVAGTLQVVAGAWHGIALRWDRTVVCWGSNGSGQTNVPSDLGPVLQVSGHSSDSTIVLLLDGSVRGWGRNLEGQLDSPTGMQLVRFGLSGYHGVGIKSCSADSDSDGVIDCSDACPTDPNKIAPGICGCGVLDVDADGDGVLDCLLPESLAALATLSPTSPATNDDFGTSVALTSTFAAVGAPLDDLPGKTDAGSVRVFTRGVTGWSQTALVQAPDAIASDRFGSSVALHGDVLVVGAPLANLTGAADAGAAYVFRRTGSSWTFEQKLVRFAPAATDRFGTSVAIRGSLIAVGAPLANRLGVADSGEVAIFRFDGSSWLPVGTVGSSPLAASDQFGASVSLGGDAATPRLAVGTPGDDEAGKLNCGAVYAFALNSDGSVSDSARHVGNPAIASAGLGTSVAVDGSGGRIAAGAPLADFTGMADRGSITVWTQTGSTWTGTNLAHSLLTAADRFGASLAWSTDDACLVIGSPGDKIGGLTNRGSAAVLSRRGDGSYQLHDLLVLPASGTSGSLFGTAVAASDAGVLIGAPKHTPPAGGTARLFAAPAPCSGVDTDGDGTDDCTDADDDNDGTQDGSDLCGRDANKIAPGTCGCGVADTDSDGDGTANCIDGCPNDAAKLAPGQCGCGVADTDSDSDGTANCNDGCPSDAAKIAPGVCGCGTPETGDSDGDELPDCLDFDDDNDGTDDTGDLCPLDAGKTAPGQCGCGVADTDGDSDGTANCNDGCPGDPAKIAPGACGCGTADVDADADGLVDCLGGGTLEEVATLDSTGVLNGDDFGAAVAADGDTIVVGIPLDDLPGKADAGSARVYRRTGETWTQEAQLLAPSVDAKAKDYFGTSVAVHGEVAVVGTPSSDPSAITDAGAVYVFRRTGSTWNYEAKLTRPGLASTDRFGLSVAVRGEMIAVGAPQANAGGANDSGEVTVFLRTAGVWTPAEILTSAPVTGGDRFGQAVALGGTVARPTLAVGATGDDQPGKTNCGAVYAHTLNADGTLATVARLVAAEPVKSAGLGASVAVNEDGTRIASGAPLGDRVGVGTDSGLATVWTLDAGAWSATDVNPPDHAAGERFGTSVAFDAGGLSLTIGSPYDMVGGIAQRGSVAVFTRSGSQWNMHDRLAVTGGTAASRFGTAVATVPSGIVVGAPKHAPPAGGTVRVFQSALVPWATILEHDPNPTVVTDESLRNAIVATGLPWRVRDNASQVELLLVPPGTFTMGTTQGAGQFWWEGPPHQVTLTRPYYLGRYEIKQSEWQAVMGSNPSFFAGRTDSPDRPVDRVSWENSQAFGLATGLRLPTEAEWERACRAGTTGPLYAGPLNSVAWYSGNLNGETRSVGLKQPNALGFHDMIGNVWEWVRDWWGEYPAQAQVDPTGPLTGDLVPRRGGSYHDYSIYCTTTFRAWDGVNNTSYSGTGVRMARDP